eukprot:4747163-Lingulodinium_polyedra.AAC.1
MSHRTQRRANKRRRNRKRARADYRRQRGRNWPCLTSPPNAEALRAGFTSAHLGQILGYTSGTQRARPRGEILQ